ncbi:hypothetical protein D3C73_764150 [compost metagenome]
MAVDQRAHLGFVRAIVGERAQVFSPVETCQHRRQVIQIVIGEGLKRDALAPGISRGMRTLAVITHQSSAQVVGEGFASSGGTTGQRTLLQFIVGTKRLEDFQPGAVPEFRDTPDLATERVVGQRRLQGALRRGVLERQRQDLSLRAIGVRRHHRALLNAHRSRCGIIGVGRGHVVDIGKSGRQAFQRTDGGGTETAVACTPGFRLHPTGRRVFNPPLNDRTGGFDDLRGQGIKAEPRRLLMRTFARGDGAIEQGVEGKGETVAGCRHLFTGVQISPLVAPGLASAANGFTGDTKQRIIRACAQQIVVGLDLDRMLASTQGAVFLFDRGAIGQHRFNHTTEHVITESRLGPCFVGLPHASSQTVVGKGCDYAADLVGSQGLKTLLPIRLAEHVQGRAGLAGAIDPAGARH